MTLKITRRTDALQAGLKAQDLEEGKVYEDQDGDIFIGCYHESIKAFSVCGRYVVYTQDRNLTFREVSAELIIV